VTTAVIAVDKFRGTATATEAVDALGAGLEAAGVTCHRAPMADGGEGTVDAFGGPNRTTTVTGPLGDPVVAAWRLDGRLAVIEMAAASGLALVGDANDAVAASTEGTGELIDAAVGRGARHVIVGLGGSATTDGGLGAVRALYPHHRLRGVRLDVACDVETTFLDAAAVFAPQKGATPAQVELLRRRLERLADVYQRDYDVDVRDLVGSGAAGGLGGGLAALGGNLVSGVELIADETGLPELVEAADIVVTGEGRLDRESFEGKVVGGVAEIADGAGVPVVAVVGEVADDVSAPFPVFSLSDRYGRERAVTETLWCLRDLAASLVN
jgi:glycerate kinase